MFVEATDNSFLSEIDQHRTVASSEQVNIKFL